MEENENISQVSEQAVVEEDKVIEEDKVVENDSLNERANKLQKSTENFTKRTIKPVVNGIESNLTETKLKLVLLYGAIIVGIYFLFFAETKSKKEYATDLFSKVKQVITNDFSEEDFENSLLPVDPDYNGDEVLDMFGIKRDK